MELDDLGGLEVLGGLGRKGHGQDRRESEVGGDENAAAGGIGLGEMLADPRVGLLGPSGGADDDVHTGVDEGVNIGLGDVGNGEVHGDVGAVEVLGGDLDADIEAGDELKALGLLDGLADGGSHAPGGAYDSNANRHAISLDDRFRGC